MTLTPSARLLIVTPVVPRPDGGGGSVQLYELCRCFPREQLVIAHVGHEEDTPWPPAAAACSHRRFSTPPDKFPGDSAFIRPLRALRKSVRDIRRRRRSIPDLVRRITAFGREQGVDRILVPLATPTLLELAKPLAEALASRLIPIVWDPPGYKMRNFGFRKGRLRKMLRRFDRTLESSFACGVMSEAMADEYSRRYGVRCIILRFGIDLSEAREPATEPGTAGRFVIAFAGSLYARDEHRSLAKALAGVHWRIGGRDVTFRLLTDRYDLDQRIPLQVELLGWRSFEETLEALADSDACYLPYWTDPSYEEVTRLAFPTKLSMYLAAGKPVFFHGPENASPDRFLQRYPAGVSCSSLQPDDIVAALEALIEPQAYASFAAAGRQSLQEELSRSVARRRLSELLEMEAAPGEGSETPKATDAPVGEGLRHLRESKVVHHDA